MSKLKLEDRMTIQTLARKHVSHCEIARLLGITEGAVRYQIKRMDVGAVDGRSRQEMRAAKVGEAIAHWREQHVERAFNLAALHEWLVAEHGYRGSLRSVQRYWRRNFPAPALRARRRVETPAGAQSQVDWAHFPGLVVGGERVDLLALHMVLSHSRYEAVVWSPSKDLLSWLDCHTEAFKRLGGVSATVRVDNEKTAISHGAGAWGTVNTSYRRYAAVMHFHVDACPPRQPQTKGKVERKVRDQRASADPSGMCWRDVGELQGWSDERAERNARRRLCPVTGETVWETWQSERRLLTPLPEIVPEPFDVVHTRYVGIDALVSFEARQYSVPLAHVGRAVEVRGCARTVQFLANNTIVAVHPRHTPERLLINPAHYEGASTARVVAPPPLGRIGQRLLELAQEPVVHRSIDLYARLTEVAR
jgi:transposase